MLTLLALATALLRAPIIGRRAAVAGAGAALLSPSLPALAADDSSWAEHTGAFDFSSWAASPALPGFAYQKLRAGSGDRPKQFQLATVNYVMYLPDGKKVDSQDGWAFRIGVKGLGRGSQTVNDVKTIAGFENIVASLTPGSRVAVKIPPESAYGATGSTYPPVPAASPVVAYIELVSLGNIKGDKPRLNPDDNYSAD